MTKDGIACLRAALRETGRENALGSILEERSRHAAYVARGKAQKEKAARNKSAQQRAQLEAARWKPKTWNRGKGRSGGISR